MKLFCIFLKNYSIKTYLHKIFFGAITGFFSHCRMDVIFFVALSKKQKCDSFRSFLDVLDTLIYNSIAMSTLAHTAKNTHTVVKLLKCVYSLLLKSLSQTISRLIIHPSLAAFLRSFDAPDHSRGFIIDCLFFS